MKIALVHEFLNQLGGAERVLQNFLEIWPDADVFVLIYDRNKTGGIFNSYKLKTSFLDKFPFAHTHHRWLLPLMPKAIESFDFQDYDVVISDSSSFAKGAISKDKPHICYCHTPTRFLWTESEKYVDSQNGSWLTKKIAKMLLPALRKWDLKASQRPNYFIANSINVQSRIKKYYNRDSVVIYPPVDTDFFQPQGKKSDYFFTASRLEPYKKIDLVVETFNKLGWPLKVAGVGTQLVKLKSIAKPNIEFLGRVSDENLRTLYSESKAFIFPAEEDAGIMVLEAQACGTPVIAYRGGGSLETIIEGETGEFFDKQTVESLEKILRVFNESKYDSRQIRSNALKFDKRIFQEKIKNLIEEKYDISKLDFILFLKTLKLDEWSKKVSERWTVKDAVAHMIGWEKETAQIIPAIWETKKIPWFYKTNNFDEFNERSVEYYRNYSPEQLISEWQKLRSEVKDIIENIGERNLQARPDLFRWLFNQQKSNSHYNHHYKQIKNIIRSI